MSEIDDIIAEISPFYKKRKKKSLPIPSIQFELFYDSPSETLEPIYFFILDLAEKMFKDVEKVVDNFASSPGSGHFSELQGKASQMQQESSRVLGTVNNILKGVLNLIYDLKEFKIRLSHYEAAESKDENVKEAGILALKQIWMDKVDILRGAGSINALASGNLQFVTLRDAFMSVKSIKDVDKIDLNDRVKRILKPRVQEFFEWVKRSEQELKKRYEIEKIYLKSQVNALKLNARWAKPYLKAAQQLMQNEGLMRSPKLITAFNTVLFELCLMCKDSLDIKDLVHSKKIPKSFIKIEKSIRKYNKVVFIDFNFRGIPNKFGQHYTFGGRAEVKFKSYILNNEELSLLKDRLDDSDMNYALNLIQGMTDDSLLQLKADIDEILEEKENKKEETENTNPFSALFSSFIPEKRDEKEIEKEKLEKLKKKGIKAENYAEKYLRSIGEAEAKTICFDVYEIYKKGHGMATFPYMHDYEAKLPRSSAEEFFGLNPPQR